ESAWRPRRSSSRIRQSGVMPTPRVSCIRSLPHRIHGGIMRMILAVGALALVAAPTAGIAQVVTEMTPDTIKAAIADTKNDGCYALKKGFACFTPPYSRVAFAAREAKKKDEPFT